MAYRRIESSHHGAAIGGDEYALAWKHFEQVGVDRPSNAYLDVQLFLNFSRETLGGGLADFESSARQFPFVAFIEQQHHLAARRSDHAFDGNGVHAQPIAETQRRYKDADIGADS